MARIFGTVLILAGCAGFLYKWAEGEKARQRMAGEWIRLFVRWGYALEQEHVRLYDFLSFYETADASMQAFLDEVCVCMRNHQNPSGQKIWQDCLQKHKRELQIGQRSSCAKSLPARWRMPLFTTIAVCLSPVMTITLPLGSLPLPRNTTPSVII